MNVTQDMYDVTLQQHRTIHARIELLNFQFLTVNELSGVVLTGNCSIDANSDIRRTCNISMVVKGHDFDIQTGGQIWLDKYIRLWVGIENIRNGEIVWFNQGIYMINQPNLHYDATTKTLDIEGIDLMGKLTGLRNGQLEGMSYKIPADTQIRSLLIAVLQLGGFDKYVINLRAGEETLPTEISFDSGATVYDIISKIKDIYSNYQSYFDVDGVFHFEPIPTGENETVRVTNEVFDRLHLSHSDVTDFESVKNVIEIYGKTHEPSSYGECTLAGSQYSATIASLETLDDGIMIGLSIPNIAQNPTLKINDFAAYPIVDSNGNPVVIPTANEYYVVVYQEDDESYLFLGHLQAQAVAKDTNPDSPFYIGGTTGEIRIVLSGGDYDFIYSDELAQDRADYELYLRARLNDSVNINCVPIYYLDAYDLIEFKLSDDPEPRLYIIQTIHIDYGEDGIQSISASRYYPYYPVIS